MLHLLRNHGEHASMYHDVQFAAGGKVVLACYVQSGVPPRAVREQA